MNFPIFLFFACFFLSHQIIFGQLEVLEQAYQEQNLSLLKEYIEQAKIESLDTSEVNDIIRAACRMHRDFLLNNTNENHPTEYVFIGNSNLNLLIIDSMVYRKEISERNVIPPPPHPHGKYLTYQEYIPLALEKYEINPAYFAKQYMGRTAIRLNDKMKSELSIFIGTIYHDQNDQRKLPLRDRHDFLRRTRFLKNIMTVSFSFQTFQFGNNIDANAFVLSKDLKNGQLQFSTYDYEGYAVLYLIDGKWVTQFFKKTKIF